MKPRSPRALALAVGLAAFALSRPGLADDLRGTVSRIDAANQT